MNNKFAEVAQAIGRRIRAGDYAGARIPGERVLATQFGVSHMTARKAVEKLLDEGVLRRMSNGRLSVRLDRKAPVRHLAYVAPAYYSPVFERMRAALEHVAARHNAVVRPVDFVHWDDPAIPEALQSFDGIFLVPSGVPAPPRICQLLAKSGARPAISLESDLSAWGIPSLCFFPASSVERLLEHLWSLGHRSIDCFSTQPGDDVTRARILSWQEWKSRRLAGGHLIDEPVKPFELAIEQAHRVMNRMLNNRFAFSSAIVATTGVAGMAVLRALHEHGLRAGHDISVCAINGEDVARYCTPSLTSLEMPGLAPYLERAVAWICGDSRTWDGPLYVQASDVPIFVGESTGPVSKSRR